MPSFKEGVEAKWGEKSEKSSYYQYEESGATTHPMS